MRQTLRTNDSFQGVAALAKHLVHAGLCVRLQLPGASKVLHNVTLDELERYRLASPVLSHLELGDELPAQP